MTEIEFEDITKGDCKAYEGVRVSGVTNMFMVTRVCELSGLNKDMVMAIMNNYSRLNDKFNFRVN